MASRMNGLGWRGQGQARPVVVVSKLWTVAKQSRRIPGGPRRRDGITPEAAGASGGSRQLSPVVAGCRRLQQLNSNRTVGLSPAARVRVGHLQKRRRHVSLAPRSVSGPNKPSARKPRKLTWPAIGERRPAASGRPAAGRKWPACESCTCCRRRCCAVLANDSDTRTQPKAKSQKPGRSISSALNGRS